ncbi:hypothetical protein LAZ67_19001881 [Cordylochernes scorpioides]|uniref:DUF5641 domain-containing protein n=1 Tax=Cordylochernes scorpioides TaxID=51811 RepID=A0ABY6LI39_9ARAC|nr:hypothetical protein LAZ67_19001881 [Cordylochernes scorpioides]
MSGDPNDQEVLTPAHFLMTDWCKNYYNICGKDGRENIFHNLQQRHKWKTSFPNIKINILVLIKEDRLPPAKWLKGRIMEVDPGKDGLVRVATVKTSMGVLRRPLVKLVMLPVAPSEFDGVHQPRENDIYDKWLTWLGKLKEIARVRVPRCYDFGFECAKEKELHVFVDASHEAYALIAYLKCIKARVAPVRIGERKRTIPQLEFAVTIKCEFNSRLDRIVFWTYSKVVLSWIRADDVRHKEFEANRIGEIQEATGHFEWKWVPTDTLPTDLKEISSEPCDMWFTGPEFFMNPKKDWPQEFNAINCGIAVMTALEPDVEEDGVKLCRRLFPLENFSTLSRLVRRTAAVQREASYCSQKLLKFRDGITLEMCS